MATDTEVFSMMQTDTPYKCWIKTVPSLVYVNILNPFDGKVEGQILKGNPRKFDRESIVELWSEKEEVYFKRANRIHIETGTIIPYIPKAVVEVTEEEKLNSMSDEELELLLGKPFLSMQKTVNKITSTATLFRLLETAKALDKSDKTTTFLEARLAEKQLEE